MIHHSTLVPYLWENCGTVFLPGPGSQTRGRHEEQKQTKKRAINVRMWPSGLLPHLRELGPLIRDRCFGKTLSRFLDLNVRPPNKVILTRARIHQRAIKTSSPFSFYLPTSRPRSEQRSCSLCRTPGDEREDTHCCFCLLHEADSNLSLFSSDHLALGVLDVCSCLCHFVLQLAQ